MNAMFDLELVDPSGLFIVEPKSAVGLTNVAIQLGRFKLDYENPNQQKFILLVCQVFNLFLFVFTRLADSCGADRIFEATI